MNQQENNFCMSGSDARILMAALSSSSVSLPAAVTLQLYARLNEISSVQPPINQPQ